MSVSDVLPLPPQKTTRAADRQTDRDIGVGGVNELRAKATRLAGSAECTTETRIQNEGAHTHRGRVVANVHAAQLLLHERPVGDVARHVDCALVCSRGMMIVSERGRERVRM